MLTDGEFGTLDLNTGKFSVLGAEGGLLVGPGVFDGVLYADSGDGQPYTVNTANGAMTARRRIGSAGRFLRLRLHHHGPLRSRFRSG